MALLLPWGAGGCRGRRSAFRPQERPDIVLVTIDTLRADAVGYSGSGKAETPNIDALAQGGLVFSEAHAQNVVTLPSHANILTGLYPFQHGVRDNEGFRLDPKTPTLATMLKARGYSTGAFIGAFPLDSRFGLSTGFDVYDQHYPVGAHSYDFLLPERSAPEVLRAAAEWFRSLPDKPRFLWVHLYDCHFPYAPPPPFDRQYASDPYFGEVAAVDRELAPFLNELKASKRPFFLVLTGDHGEALGDHGEPTHSLFAYEATLHVPLLIWSPGSVEPGRDKSMARHIDIAPTILEAAGIPRPADLPGVSLLHPRNDRNETSYFEALSCSFSRGWAPLRGEVGRGFKYIDLPIPELYDLSADPKEEKNLVSTGRDAVRFLKNALPAEGKASAPSPISSEEASKLRNLGYLSGQAPAKSVYTEADDPKNLIPLDNQLHKLVEHYQHGEMGAALSLGRDIVRERPAMQTGYEFLSFLQAQSGDDAGAVQTLEEANRRHLLTDALFSRLGLIYSEMGRSADALRVLEPLAGSRNPDVLNALGIARAGAGKFSESIRAFESAVAADPGNAAAYQNIGLTYLNRGRFAEALDAFDRAFALNDRLPRAWNGRGVALELAGRTDEAMAAWSRAIELDPTQFDALFNLGLTAVKKGDVGRARSALSQFIQRAPAARYRGDIERSKSILARLPPEPGPGAIH